MVSAVSLFIFFIRHSGLDILGLDSRQMIAGMTFSRSLSSFPSNRYNANVLVRALLALGGRSWV